jgi:hypothetical protein
VGRERARAAEQAVGRAVAARCWAAHVLAGPKWPDEQTQLSFLFPFSEIYIFDEF